MSEDSDCLLFGCQRVYRYMFSTKNACQVTTMRQVKEEMALSRSDLQVMALFMGSDYTPGVKGIAAVNAIEIINCFGSSQADMQRFKKWVTIETQI